MFKHISEILPKVITPSTFAKFNLIRGYSKTLNKSQLKQLVMNCYHRGALTSEEVTVLFNIHGLRAV